jgi:hypothetical protein
MSLAYPPNSGWRLAIMAIANLAIKLMHPAIA